MLDLQKKTKFEEHLKGLDISHMHRRILFGEKDNALFEDAVSIVFKGQGETQAPTQEEIAELKKMWDEALKEVPKKKQASSEREVNKGLQQSIRRDKTGKSFSLLSTFLNLTVYALYAAYAGFVVGFLVGALAGGPAGMLLGIAIGAGVGALITYAVGFGRVWLKTKKNSAELTKLVAEHEEQNIPKLQPGQENAPTKSPAVLHFQITPDKVDPPIQASDKRPRVN